jgi:hypothetical protein
MSSTEARDQATGGSPAQPARRAGADGHAGGPRRRRRRWVAVAALVVIIVAGVAVAADEGAFGTSGTPSAGTATSRYATSAFTVRREPSPDRYSVGRSQPACPSRRCEVPTCSTPIPARAPQPWCALNFPLAGLGVTFGAVSPS